MKLTDQQLLDNWAELQEIYPPYAAYKVRAGDRVIPVVVFEPVE